MFITAKDAENLAYKIVGYGSEPVCEEARKRIVDIVLTICNYPYEDPAVQAYLCQKIRDYSQKGQ
jgi:hypothetical protein